MRFLELNGLCHRHLRASNIVVHQSTNHIYAVKITDYLVPYHFLDEDTVEMINMCDLDWPWWAPECLQNHLFDIVTDIWAFGCVIFEEDETDTFLDELLFMCVNYEPESRPTFDHLFNFFRALLFDFAVGPDPAIQKYIKKSPKKFNHAQRTKQ
ncbi:hypothetical protein TELCIR_00920 [Teladorsagia circumcincta]|uniref:Protein kinase domain-containing protein n=1 Tax=Teladorsagia circumcincta TaxID=45464 RepID=A0A2G9V4S7_TELCI|nr:hypothetical protein TELCIR_00920 [Teladorsagia circumcincta]